MLKRILLLVCVLAVAGNAEYMTDYASKGVRPYGPWQMTEHKIYWWAPSDTDEVATYCDTVTGPTRILDTAFTRWVRLPSEADAYVCLFKMTEGDTTFGAHVNDTLQIDVQSANDISGDVVDSIRNIDNDLLDTTSVKFYAHPDSFLVGSYTWGIYVRARVIKQFWIVADSCLQAIHRTETQPGRTTIELWIQALDTYP